MSSNAHSWDLRHLQRHLQYAVDLEFWTIPFYMAAMYSIKDPSSDAYRLLQSVVYQEMLHTQLAGNLANAYGCSPTFQAPEYPDPRSPYGIPHLNFKLDQPNPAQTLYMPYSAAIGPLDVERLNAMCLVEYPEWDTQHAPDLQEDHTNYGSIGEFYDAVVVGAVALTDYLKGDRHQVNLFQRFYRNFAQPTITGDGVAGRDQVLNLINVITEQGEGRTQGDVDIPAAFQNTADGFYPGWSHYRKFIFLRASQALPETYDGVATPEPGGPGALAQDILRRNFTTFRARLEALFRGEKVDDFGPLMDTIGGNILTCWQRQAIPAFS